MRSLILTLALLVPSCLNSSEYDELAARLIKFEIPYNRFLRAYFGCPETGDIGPEVCSPARRERRYGDWVKACEAAADLFQFKGGCREER